MNLMFEETHSMQTEEAESSGDSIPPSCRRTAHSDALFRFGLPMDQTLPAISGRGFASIQENPIHPRG